MIRSTNPNHCIGDGDQGSITLLAMDTASNTARIPTKGNCTFWDYEEVPSRTWEMFERQMTLFFKVTKLQIGRDLTGSEKNLILLGSLGGKGLDNFFQTSNIVDPETEDHENLLLSLREIFKTNVSHVRAFHDFANASLEPSETINDYIARITALCKNADLAMKDNNYFVAMKLAQSCGRMYPDTQKTMLAKETPDFKEFKNLLLAAETSRADQKVLNREPNINVVKTKTTKYERKKPQNPGSKKADVLVKCTRCGASERHSKENCPAKSSTCHGCGRIGHFKKMCFSKTVKAVHRIGSAKADFQAKVEILADGATGSQEITFDVDSGADISGVLNQYCAIQSLLQLCA